MNHIWAKLRRSMKRNSCPCGTSSAPGCAQGRGVDPARRNWRVMRKCTPSGLAAWAAAAQLGLGICRGVLQVPTQATIRPGTELIDILRAAAIWRVARST